jgi:ParB family transcriptional regulator, chromosome partitioning protein
MSQTPKRGLGRGFESLLAPDFDKARLLASKDDRIEHVALDKLEANPMQPRRHFDEKTLNELAVSIKKYGVVQPLVVMPVKNGTYTIIAGERRWRAAVIAGLNEVPAIVRSSKMIEQLEVALIENVQREDLHLLDQAISLERLHEQFSISYDEIGARLGKSPSTIINIVRLLQLPDFATEALNQHKITEGHARQILALKGHLEDQRILLDSIIKNGWSVRQAERFVLGYKESRKDTKQAKAHVRTETPLTRRLGKKLETPVRIRRMAKGGFLEISFTSEEDLTRIIKNLK